MQYSKSEKSETPDWKVSDVSRKYPTFRKSLTISVESWLKGKQTDDEAEGLWRIQDTLYDFTDFIDRHPGGAFWLEKTKGTDITEPFESHHISQLPEKMLAKYKVRPATQPRNYTLTMHEDGFYKTLKGRVREQLKEIDYSASKRADFIHLGLLAASLVLPMASAKTRSAFFEIPAALAISWLTISAHNYFHKRDNWQMYTFNLSLMNFSTWRISHALSHHVLPNSLHDLEMAAFEPLLFWIPNRFIASKLRRIISMFIEPMLCAIIFPMEYTMRLLRSLLGKRNVMYWHDLIGLIIPALMLTVSDAPVSSVIKQWLYIMHMASFIFGIIGLNAAHHGPQIHHDGDARRQDRDWGIYQMDTVIDRGDIKSSQFLVQTHFGEHALHHLFPTLDHGILPQLYPVFLKTLNEFKLELRESNFLGHIWGQNMQLLRTTQNPNPPDSRRTEKSG